MNIVQVHAGDELLVISEQGKIMRTPAGDIRTAGRATQGVRLMVLDQDDRVVSTAIVPPAGEDDEPLPDETVETAAAAGGAEDAPDAVTEEPGPEDEPGPEES